MKTFILLFAALGTGVALSAQAAVPARPAAAPAAIAPALKGIRLVPDMPAGDHAGREGLDLEGIPLLAASDLPGRLRPRLGQPLRITDIDVIVREIRATCVRLGRPFTQVIIPPQDITRGVLTFVVLEARVGTVKVEGAKWFSEASYLSALHLTAGQPIDKTRLDDDLAWLARSGHRRVSAQASPGSTLGTTDIVLQAEERKPWHFHVGYSDTGTATTGDERIFGGGSWAEIFGGGQSVSYQLTTSPDLKKSVAHSAGYERAIRRWRHVLRVDAAWSTIRADIPAPFDSKGYSWQIGLNYEIPLRQRKLGTAGAVTHFLTAGFDLKETNNNIEFSSMPVTDNTTQVAQFRVGYDASRQDRLGGTSFKITGVFSPGGLIGNNDDAAFVGSRSGAQADYAYVNLSVQRQTRLPHGFSHALTLTGQLASANLLGSEQLGLGGAHSVRGYDEGLVYGDQGVLFRNEITLPAFSVTRRIGKGLPGDSVCLLGFWDYGVARSKHLLTDEDPNLILSSVGLGLRYRLGDHFSAQFDYGWQQKAAGFPTREEHGRGHVSATVSW